MICPVYGVKTVRDSRASPGSHQVRRLVVIKKISVVIKYFSNSGNYEVTQDIKQQLRFLEDLDKMEKKRHEEAERELLLRAAKSRYNYT